MGDGFPDWVSRLFQGFFAAPAAEPAPARSRLDRLPFALHLIVGGSSVELFPAGHLDPLVFHQRHHDSLHHDLEYVVAVPEGNHPEDHRAYAVFRLRPELALPLVDRREIDRRLQLWYGAYASLPGPRSLLERPESPDLRDDDPPAGLHRLRAPEREPAVPGRFPTAEVLDIARRELAGPELVSWLEEAFRVPPRRGRVEHRYYMDATAALWLVREDPAGKTLYRAETSTEALRPERTGR